MTKIDFIGNSKKYFTLSVILIAAAVLGAIFRGVDLDIQFKGGSIVTYSYDGVLDTDHFRSLAQELTNAVITTQESTDLATRRQTIVISLPGTEGMDSSRMLALTEGLQAAFPDNDIQTMEISNVDPTIGGEFLAKCLTAVGIAAVLMVLFVWLRFRKIGGLSAGAMAVVALLHDLVITFGVFVLFGFNINDNFIAVLLTILGYSLNDTIVIYDRIRENERKVGGKADLGELVNLSINQSFRRSMVTSITTVTVMLIVSVVAWVNGVDSILTFSIPLVFGLACGNYSSLCIAGPLWVRWQNHKHGKTSAA